MCFFAFSNLPFCSYHFGWHRKYCQAQKLYEETLKFPGHEFVTKIQFLLDWLSSQFKLFFPFLWNIYSSLDIPQNVFGIWASMVLNISFPSFYHSDGSDFREGMLLAVLLLLTVLRFVHFTVFRKTRQAFQRRCFGTLWPTYKSSCWWWRPSFFSVWKVSPFCWGFFGRTVIYGVFHTPCSDVPTGVFVLCCGALIVVGKLL